MTGENKQRKQADRGCVRGCVQVVATLQAHTGGARVGDYEKARSLSHEFRVVVFQRRRRRVALRER